MSRPTPARLATPMSEGVIRQFMEKVASLEDRLDRQEGVHQDLVDRVALLETRASTQGTGRRALNDDAIEALRFMETHYPMKFTALTLAENLANGTDHKRLGGQLRVMLTRGLVAMHSKPEGGTNMWSAVAPEDRKGRGDDE